jgi:hypothetical protein
MQEVRQRALHWSTQATTRTASAYVERNQMNIINTIKAMYAAPSPETLALRELEQSRRDLLVSHTQQEYSLKMVEFHKNKIKRLTAFLKQTMEDEQT